MSTTKNLSGVVLVLLLICSKMQIYLRILLLIVSCFSKIKMILPFWCRLTQVALDKRAFKSMIVLNSDTKFQ